MQNGTYLLKHKMLGTEYKLIAYAGSLKLYSMKDQFIKYYPSEKNLLEHCDVIKQIPGNQNNYDLLYMINGKPKEIIKLNASYGIAIHKKYELRSTTHKNGVLVPIRCDHAANVKFH